jgi:hypothetical protein
VERDAGSASARTASAVASETRRSIHTKPRSVSSRDAMSRASTSSAPASARAVASRSVMVFGAADTDHTGTEIASGRPFTS